MPKEITHCLFAEKAFQTLDINSPKADEIKNTHRKRPQALFFGSIAPDLFYYDISLPWQKKTASGGEFLSDLIHGAHGEDSLAHVREMLCILKTPQMQTPLNGKRALHEEEIRLLTLFTMGYLSHVALDTLLHPAVYYLSGNYYASDSQEKACVETRHRVVETVYDLYNLDRFQISLSRFNLNRRISLPKKMRHLILGFFSLSILQAWPEIGAKLSGTGVIPQNIQTHPLFEIAKRSYKKQVFCNKLFQQRVFVKGGLAANRFKANKLAQWSSLLYPEKNYARYKSAQRVPRFRIEDIHEYRDPVTNRILIFDAERIEKRLLARIQKLYALTFGFVYSNLREETMRRFLRGFSLNNGHAGVPTDAMQFFSPIQVDGNFKYTAEGVKA